MTTAQHIQWIALPAGLSPDGTQARLSVFVAPRLASDGPGTLAAFPDFLDWPARMAGATFALTLGDESGVPDGETPLVPLTRTGQPADSALWQLFFPAGTPVDEFEFDDHRQSTMVTYPARELADTTRRSFASSAAESPDSMPPSQQMSTLAGFAAAGDMQDAMQGMRENIVMQLAAADRQVADQPGELVRPELSPQEAFLAFHEPQPQVPGLVADGGPHIAPPPEVPHVDFHQLLSSLGDHPKLLRRLGLVLDFVAPVGLLPGSGGELTVFLVPDWDPLLGPDTSHDHAAATRYALAPGQGFCAAADGNDAFGPPARGLLALPDGEYAIEQADIDGITLKLLAAAVAADTDEEAEAAPPTVRTKGLSLVLGDRTRHLHDTFQRNADRQDALAEDTTVVLTAEDLVRGHRLDIFDESRQRWFSLHEREVAYDRAGSPGDHLDTASDEGFFQLSLATPTAAPGAAQRVHVHEHLVTWDGWALSAPHPGKAVANGDGPERIPNAAATTLPLEIDTRPRPGSLPHLRFGRSYRIRIRTVDLAGNGPTLEEADGLLDQDVLVLPATGGPVFRRFEAVPPPLLLPRVEFTEGTSAHRLVIRSTAELSPAQYAETFNASPPVTDGTHPPYHEVDERHVVAPKASLDCVERHGKLDEAIGSGDADARRRFYAIASRESGSLDDASLPDVVSVTYPSATPDAAEGHYVLYTGETIDLPYLPDPLADGVVFHELPGMPERQLFEVPWNGAAWHAPQSIRLRVEEGDGAPVFDPSTRVLTVLLPKATLATVRVCSRVKVNEKTMGMLKWCRDALDPDRFESVMAAARANRHWMLTPWHAVTLVHAVQRPLTAPLLTLSDGPDRLPGATGEHLVGSMELSAASTERIDMIASWRENVDDLAMPGPSVLEVTTPVFRLPLAAAVPPDPVASEDSPSTLDGDSLTFNTVVAEELAFAVEPDQPPGTPVPAKCEFGDNKHRDVTFTPVATSRFGDYFPPEFARDTDREMLSVHGDPVEHTVLSSAKPAAPHVSGTFLTLGIETFGSLPDGLFRRRRGGGFRVYLSRPWFSSGDGELLAVVLGIEGDEQPLQAHPFITLMGRDPIRGSAPVFLPSASNFPGASTMTDVALPEVFDGFAVTAAGFEPTFDGPSGRWYCDIEVDTGDAYFPFLRPALARLQQRSLEGFQLSQIVLTEALRLLPPRTLTVSGTDPLTVQLTGPAYHDDNSPPTVAAGFQVRDPDVPDPVLGWLDLDETELLADDDTSLFPTYSADIPLPDPRPDLPLRLLVSEMAATRSDFALDEFGPAVASLVYADAVDL
ncbi:hypothetical protein [Embleya scabrispora]|uniref:hypothetical protein n=1 Tax=Embleya scabrispora TaxID=159449 RepID=UPI00035CA2B2|nr:hypothetical protein [Embleya scabrispora]MYS84830.1 hypothetical protein [Streptomyces sp. SID5474]